MGSGSGSSSQSASPSLEAIVDRASPVPSKSAPESCGKPISPGNLISASASERSSSDWKSAVCSCSAAVVEFLDIEVLMASAAAAEVAAIHAEPSDSSASASMHVSASCSASSCVCIATCSVRDLASDRTRGAAERSWPVERAIASDTRRAVRSRASRWPAAEKRASNTRGVVNRSV